MVCHEEGRFSIAVDQPALPCSVQNLVPYLGPEARRNVTEAARRSRQTKPATASRCSWISFSDSSPGSGMSKGRLTVQRSATSRGWYWGPGAAGEREGVAYQHGLVGIASLLTMDHLRVRVRVNRQWVRINRQIEAHRRSTSNPLSNPPWLAPWKARWRALYWVESWGWCWASARNRSRV